MPDIPVSRWLRPNLGLKRWLSLLFLGLLLFSTGMALTLLHLFRVPDLPAYPLLQRGWFIIVLISTGILLTVIALRRLLDTLLAPYRRQQQGDLVEIVAEHNRRGRGIKFVAIGGGTGLPASLIGIKQHTTNITAIVTVADDGGSSGRLRRDMGVLPPGDLRNNIAALADDDSLLTRLFQYRFQGGDLDGHSFGNLFIAALTSIVEADSQNQQNSLAEALVEVERVLNIRGRVIPSTLDDVHLTASVQLHGSSRSIKVRGESQIGHVDGKLEQIALVPADAKAYSPGVRAILEADMIVIGPGSLYTSILPNLMVRGIADALRATDAYKIYVCNVATQPVETEGYSVAEHVMALEQHIGRGVFQAVLANNHFPQENAGENTHYVTAIPENHEIRQRYEIHYTDLTDTERPWRHDPYKLATALLKIGNAEAQITTRQSTSEND
jgi:uncharacterized cofD-like protein